MNENIILLFNSVPQIVLVLFVLWQGINLLKPITTAYAETVRIRGREMDKQIAQEERRQAHADQLARELAQYKADEEAYRSKQAELSLQTAMVNAKIAEQLPALIGTQQQTLATVQQHGPQVEAVRGDLAELITQLHQITSDALVIVNTKQDTASDTLGRIEAAQTDDHDEQPDDTTPPAES